MKTTITLLSILLIGVVLSSCGNHTSNKETTAEDVKNEMQESADAAKNFVADEYDELLNSLEQFKDETDQKINSLKEQPNNLREDLIIEYNIKIMQIEAESKELNEKLEQYKQATGEKKDALKEEIQNRRSALNESIKTYEEEINKDI